MKLRQRFVVESLEERTLLSITLGNNHAGLAFPDTSEAGEPPDTVVAVGPHHVVELVNTDMVIFDKATGAQVFRQSLQTFFSPLGNVSALTDPVVSFDELRGRFVAGVLELDYSSALNDFRTRMRMS
jgi:hypothetical protein